MSPFTRLASYRDREEQWQNLLSTSAVDTLFTTPQWQKIWWEQFGDGAEMFLLSLNGQNGIEGMASLARRERKITFIGSQDLFDYNDFLVAKGAESRFYSCLLNHLDGEEWETLELSSVPEDSPTLTYLPDIARKHGYVVDVKEEDVSPGLSLPDSWGGYLQGLSKKDRHELRRKLRRLYSAEPEFRLSKVSDPLEVESSLEKFFVLMRTSREAKHHFLTPAREQFFRRIAGEMSSIGVFKLFLLEQGGQPVAAAMCFDYGSARLLYNSGYDPAYSYYGVGLTLKALCLKDAIEDGMSYFDFLRGSEPYKYDLGGKDKAIYQLVVSRI